MGYILLELSSSFLPYHIAYYLLVISLLPAGGGGGLDFYSLPNSLKSLPTTLHIPWSVYTLQCIWNSSKKLTRYCQSRVSPGCYRASCHSTVCVVVSSLLEKYLTCSAMLDLMLRDPASGQDFGPVSWRLSARLPADFSCRTQYLPRYGLKLPVSVVSMGHLSGTKENFLQASSSPANLPLWNWDIWTISCFPPTAQRTFG